VETKIFKIKAMSWFKKKQPLVELKDYNGFPNSVYVNGVALKGQLPEEATIEDGFIVVRCITDKRMSGRVEIPKEVNCFRFVKENSDPEITTFYFKKND